MPGERLPKYTSLGSYTLAYYAKDGSEFCAKCANESDTGEHITDADVYWEGPVLNCSHCDCEIESSYGETAFGEVAESLLVVRASLTRD